MTRREFTQATKKARYEHCKDANGIPHCEYCGGLFSAANPPEYHHHVEAESGGDNSFENCRCIGKKCCHRGETSRFKTACAKADRIRATAAGMKRRYPWPKQKFGGWRKAI